jgi:hypothetical protein
MAEAAIESRSEAVGGEVAVSCKQCGFDVWLGFFWCPFCGKKMKDVPRPFSGPGTIACLSTATLRVDTAEGLPQLIPVAGDAWVLTRNNTYHVKGKTGDLLPLEASFGPGTVETLEYGRWLIARQGNQLHCCPSAYLSGPPGLPRYPLPLGDVGKVVSLHEGWTHGTRGVSGRLSSMARLGDRLVVLGDCDNRSPVAQLDLRFEPSGPRWNATCSQPVGIFLRGTDWAFDRGASLDRDVVVCVSREANQLAVLKASAGQQPQALLLEVPDEAGLIRPGCAAWLGTGLLVVCDDGDTTNICLWEDLRRPPKLIEAPPRIDGLAPSGRRPTGARCWAGTAWFDFEPTVMRFRPTNRQVPPLNEVLTVCPGGVVYLSRQRRFIEVALAWGGVEQVCELRPGLVVRAAVVCWPRIWLMIEEEHGLFAIACYQHLPKS